MFGTLVMLKAAQHKKAGEGFLNIAEVRPKNGYIINFQNNKEMTKVSNAPLMEGLRERTPQKAAPQPNHMNCILEQLFPGEEVLHDCSLRTKEGRSENTAGRYRFDYVLPQRRLAIEIDGDSRYKRGHYSDAAICIKDYLKTSACAKAGYRLVRIPFFVQLSPDMVRQYFGITHAQELYPACHCHGFAHPQAPLPADFCELGIRRFNREMTELPYNVREKIIETLVQRIAAYRSKGYPHTIANSLVLPERLWYLIGE